MASFVRKLSQFNKTEVQRAFKSARRVGRHPGLTILLSSKQHETGRVLIIASRKVGSAPERNLLRRQLKAIFYEEKLFERGFECIIILRKEAVGLSFTQLKELLLDAYHRA